MLGVFWAFVVLEFQIKNLHAYITRKNQEVSDDDDWEDWEPHVGNIRVENGKLCINITSMSSHTEGQTYFVKRFPYWYKPSLFILLLRFIMKDLAPRHLQHLPSE